MLTARCLPGAQALAPARHDRMPYRIFFGQIGERLKATYEGRPNAYQNSRELLADVQLAADSLTDNRGRHAGYFLVRRFIRRVRTFGFHIAALDITQSARMHHEVIAQGLGMPEWPELPRARRLELLRDLLARDQGPTEPLDACARRSLWVFDTIAHARHKFGAGAIGAYIVSAAEGADDVLAVLLLARWAGIADKHTGECRLDIAPLLESIEALEQAGELLRALAAEPAYRRHLTACGDRQTLIIGYSDPGKETGIAASRWALRVAQQGLLEAARQTGLTVTIFHARGGTRARGGGRIESLVEAAPSGSIRGVLRLTEQGEVVDQSYGLRPIAMRTLERAFSALALATAHADSAAPVAPAQLARDEYDRCAQPRGVSAPGVRRCAICRVLPGGDAARCHRAHAHRLTPGRARGRGRHRARCARFLGCSPGRKAATCCPAGSASAAASRPLSRSTARRPSAEMAREWPFFAHLLDDVEAMLGAHRSGNRRSLRCARRRCAARARRSHPPGICN